MDEELIESFEAQIEIQRELLSLKDELIETLKENSANLRNHIAELDNIIDSYREIITRLKTTADSSKINLISHYFTITVN
jgi:uncharacterized coiled-coil DUF342 family protein